jgi:DHA2 family multidrug resistance protein
MAIWAIGVTLGPILGPALGGWLTEHYNWRWIFYINVPIGIISFFGIVTFMAESRVRKSRFDFFGFTALSIAIGALQLMLDRGQTEDWFNSAQICVTAGIAGVALYLFVVHMLTTGERPFVSPALFKDRNFTLGSLFIFIVGTVLFSVLSLLPPMLQHLLKYPVILTGVLTAPRGIGMLVAMVIVGRIVGKVDVRIIIGAGFFFTAVSLWQMTGFYLQMDSSIVVWSGLVQGLGIGAVYVPLAAVTFATLSPQLRDEGTALFSLLRNFGSSVGISCVATLLTRNTQVMHARLAEHITPYGAMVNSAAPLGWSSPHELAMLNERVTTQAAMIAYNNDFKLMLIVTLCASPLVLMLRDRRIKNDVKTVAIE